MVYVRLLIILVLTALAAPASADVVFPTGSRIGLVPPPEMSVSRGVVGFDDRATGAVILLVALPPQAFADIAQTTTEAVLLKQGLKLESREDFPLPAGKAVLFIGRQEVQGLPVRKWVMVASIGSITALVTVQVPEATQSHYPDALVRTTLASIVVRDTVPPKEQLGLLPFRMTELAGFNIGRLIPGRAVMLTDGLPEVPVRNIDTHILVGIAQGGPARADERDNFARDVFSAIPDLKDVRISYAEPLRIGGLQGHQIMARGKDAISGADLTIIQWLRFGGGAYLHMVGIARSEAWTPAYGRFRQVRDGIELR